MKRNPKASHIWMPREQKTEEELYREVEWLDSKALLIVLAFFVFVMVVATHNNTQRQTKPITTTVEDYR